MPLTAGSGFVRFALATAAAYYLTGILGVALAIPPGYATVIWPSAGVALAASLLGGRRAALGVFLGSFLVHLSGHVAGRTLAEISGSLAAASAVAAGIAASAAVQAAIGAYSSRAWGAYPAAPASPVSVAKLFAAGGLAAGFLDALFGNALLVATGLLGPDNGLHSFLVWWSGNVVGVISVTPAMLGYALAPAGQKWRHASLPAAASLIGLALMSALVFADVRAVDSDERGDFAALSSELAAQVASKVDLGLHAVEGLAGDFEPERRPNLTEFRALADRLAAFGLGIQALEWIPRVEDRELSEMESELSQQWRRPFTVFERADGKPRHVGTRPEYFPVAYVTPLKGNEGAVGFDLASNPARNAALSRARQIGAPVATAGVKLVQNGAMGILLFVPVYDDNASQTPPSGDHALKGFALGVFSVPDLVGFTAPSEFSRDLKYWLVDETDPKAPALLTSNATGPWSPAESDGGGLFGHEAPLASAERIKVADRAWTLHLAPSNAYLSRRTDNSPYYLMCGGLLLMAFSSGFFLVVSERQNELVDSREQDLRNQKFALDQHAIVSITDRNGIITYANDLFCAVSGLPRERLIGASHNIVSSGRQSKAFYEEMWSTLKGGRVWRGEICNRNAAGDLYWLAATLAPLEDSSGKTKEFIAICTDVTALKRLEQDLEQSRAFLQSVTDSMGEGVYTIDRRGLCTFINAEGERLLGWTLAELKGRSLHDLVHFQTLEGEPIPDTRCAIMHGLDESGEYRSEDQYFTHRDGKLFPVSIVGKRIVGDDDALSSVIVFQDITERRQVLDRLRISEERLSVALNVSSTGLWDFNPITGMAVYSESWFRMLGREPLPNPCHSDVFFSLLHPDDREGYDLALARHLDEGAHVVECEFRMRRANGEWAWIRSIGKLIELDADGWPLRMVGVHIDTTASHAAQTELANATDAAVRANLAKSEFLATMSHEIRTPMNAIIGLAHLLARTDLKPRQRDFLEKIQNASQSLLAIINDILDFSKIEAGKLTIELVEFHFDDVVKSSLSLVGPKVNEKGLKLVVARGPEIPSDFVGDPLRLEQILTNLLSNAVKFTAQGEVRLAVDGRPAPDGRFVLSISVSDTGIGMSEDQMARLFRPFTQADASTTRHFGGTGLGLAICRQLLHIMGGDISVGSRPGIGTTFTVELPLRLAPPPELAELDAIAIAGKRALVVDDSRSMRRMLRASLTGFGLEVDESATAVEALSRLQTAGPFDLVALDWKLPDASGAATLTRIRVRYPETPVLLITAYGRAEVEAEVAETFGEKWPDKLHILEKPVSPKELRERVLAAFGRISHASDPLGREARDASDILLRDAKVLLVEDNPINQQVATGLLEPLGVETTVASSGEEALEILATRQFDAILMDMQMPGRDGLSTTVAIRTELGITETPIIAMTANAMAGDRERCLESGMNDHIPKPIDPGRLALTLAKWLETTGFRVSRRVAPIAVVGRPRETTQDGDCFDRAAALYNLADNEDLLIQLIEMFAEEHGEDAKAIAAALEAGERRRVCALSHGLKGAASTLGARRVAEIALALEMATRDGGTEASLVELKPKLADLGLALEQAIAAMAAARPAREDPARPAAAAPPDREAALAAIDALAVLLLTGDAEAEPESERLTELFAGAEDGARQLAAAIRAAAERYDFDEAQARLGHLREDVMAWS